MRQLIFTGLFIFFTCCAIAQTADTVRVYTLADTVVAKSLLEEGTKLNNDRKLEGAFVKLTEAGEIYKQVLGEETAEYANVLFQMGRNKYFLKKYDDAIKHYNRSLNIKIKNLGTKSIEFALSYNNLALVYYDTDNYVKAADFFEKTIEIRKEVLGNNHELVSVTLNNLGNVYSNLGNFEKSLTCHKEALNIRLNKFGLNSPQVAQSNSNIGNTLLRIGYFDECEKYYKTALNIRQKILSESHIDIAESYNNIGVLHDRKEDNKSAIEFYKKALEIYVKNYGLNSIEVIDSYNNIGVAYNNGGNYNKALEFYEKALSIVAENKSIEYSLQGLSRLYNNIGIVYDDYKDYNKSIFYYNKGIEILGKDNEGELLAALYLNISVSYWNNKMYDEAIKKNQKSLDVFKSLFGENHFEIARCYLNLGTIYLSMKKADMAISLFEQSLNILLDLPIPHDLATLTCYLNLGEAYFLKKNNNRASYYFKTGLQSNKYKKSYTDNITYLDNRIFLLKNLSKVYQNNHRLTHSRPALDTALDYAQQAYAALQYQQQSLSTEGSKAQLLETHYPVYEGAIQTSLMVADLDKNDSLRHTAFDYAERSKAALLRAKMKESEALGYAGIPDSLLQQEYDLRIDISWRERQRQEKINAGQSETDSAILALSGKIFDLRQRYDTLKTRFEREYPAYYRAKYDLRTLSLREVQQTLLEPEQTLLEYFVGDSAVYAFVANRGDYQVLKIKKDFHLDSLVRVLRESIVSPHDRPLTDSVRNAAPVAYAQSAALLYEKLVAPAKPYLKSRVVIVPDGPLGYLPFEVLLTKRPEKAYRFNTHPYLLHEHQISYCYSATLLRDMRDLRRRKDKEQVPAGAWLGMAPYFTSDTTLLADLFAYADDVRKDLRPLPFAGKEVANIAKLMQGKALYGKDASKKAFEQLAPQYRVLHLSTHGQANDRSGDYSFLAFGESKDSTGSDLLYVHDLYNYALNADLITLSACETGIGQLLRGEGIVSLARAFSYAGAKSIATSLWQVSDAKTQELMVDFYKGLIKNNNKDDERMPTKDTALCQAKRKMAKSRDKSDPYYWAGFILIGDSGGLSEN